jgi:hypothetical protein
MEELSWFFQLLVRALACIKERGSRGYMLAERLSEMEDEDAACFLAWICRESGRKKEMDLTLVYHAVLDLSLSPQRLGEEKRRGIREAAEAIGLAEVCGLLADREPTMIAGEDTAPLTSPEMKGVTLGERKAMARGGLMRRLEQLLHDQNPAVIRNLLTNPRMTESEVLKIASKTPTSSQVLGEVARSARWVSRYRVKKALILNPYTPRAVSTGLLDLMLVQDLQVVWESRQLAIELRQRARHLWNERRRGAQDELRPED